MYVNLDHPGETMLSSLHISNQDVAALIETIAGELQTNPVIVDALEACDLQPTSRAAWLAAASAVNTLLAHEIGQEVGK